MPRPFFPAQRAVQITFVLKGHAIRLDPIEKTVRKPGNEQTPEMAAEAAAAVGKRRYTVLPSKNRAAEISSACASGWNSTLLTEASIEPS